MPPLAATPYEIARSTGRCAVAGTPLTPGDAAVIALLEREGEEGLDRLDFSPGAWQSLPEAGRKRFEGRRVFAHWRAIVPAPDEKRGRFIDDDALLDLWEQLAGPGDAPEAGADKRRDAFRFILSLILCRKRLLVHERSEPASRDGAGAIFVRRRTLKAETPAPLVRVPDPALDDETIALATEQLGAVLRGEA